MLGAPVSTSSESIVEGEKMVAVIGVPGPVAVALRASEGGDLGRASEECE